MTRVALLGFGTVGSAVARRLLTHDRLAARIALTHIFDRRAEEKAETGARGFAGSAVPVWTSRIDDVLCSDVDVVVEAIGGVEPAAEWIRAALAAGKSVVTANKQVVARHGPPLWQLAARQGRQFRFEAAVGGAMPIVRAIADGLAGDRLMRIVGILNGTTNAVLSRMELAGTSFAEALADAQARGYAEADPSSDLDGHDARAKLAILCALAFGLRVESEAIPARSVAELSPSVFAAARRHRCSIRQLAYAEYDYANRLLSAGVAPVRVPDGSIFAQTVGARNVAIVTGEHCGDVGLFGEGAGGAATAVAVLSDIAAISRDRAAIVPPPQLASDFSIRTPAFVGRSSDPPIQDRVALELQTSDFQFQPFELTPVEAS